METRTKSRGEEKLSLAIVEIIFIGLYIGIDGWYSSYSLMPDVLKVIVWALRTVMVASIVVTWVKFNDPNLEWVRRVMVLSVIALALIIGIHHATVVEDNQVSEDANKAKQEQIK